MKIIILLLVLFSSSSFASTSNVKFPDPFFFGVANAANQVEDGLNDTWKAWGEKGKIRAFQNQSIPYDRLRFWSKPEVDIELAASLGIQVFRMGLEWERIMPAPGKFDEKAIARYREILGLIKQKNMKVMLTLWHHAVPTWIEAKGGWMNEETSKYFLDFSQRAIQEFQNDVEYWITFNEANVFVTMAYSVGIWPPGEKRSPLTMAAFGPFKGEGIEALDRMADSHIEVYEWAHKNFPQIKMGLAHNMAYYTGKNWLDRIKASFIDTFMNWRFPERVRGHMDFFGFNYYGAEWLKGEQIDIDPEEEYSEAGRAVHPDGLFLTLAEIHSRFKGLPIIITENGTADALDVMKGSYIVEHLRAVHRARELGMPVIGYILWTLSDNLEWSDGYCPKFGLMGVERAEDLKRVPRESYYLFQKIVLSREVSAEIMASTWKKVLDHQGQDRPFCRGEDGITAFDEPVMRKFVKKDWRFSL